LPKGKPRKFSPLLKARVALAAIRGEHTLSQISSKFGVHSNQVGHWKKLALSRMPDLFNGSSRPRNDAADEKLLASLYEEIGRLKVELEFLKKNSDSLY
jgi:transposase